MNDSPDQLELEAIDFEQRQEVDIEELARRSQRIKVECVQCGSGGTYDVGTILWEFKGDEPKEPEFAFTRYFRCRECGSPGPWKSPARDYGWLGRVWRALLGDEDPGVVRARPQLFDGSSHQTPALAEEHFLGLLKENPGDAFLHTRLGNLLRISGERRRSAEWYEKAVALDPGDIEARCHLHAYALERRDMAEALGHACALAEHILAGRRCRKEGLAEGIAQELADNLFRYPREVRESFLAEPETRDEPPGRIFVRSLFRQEGYSDEIVERAVAALLAGEAVWSLDETKPEDEPIEEVEEDEDDDDETPTPDLDPLLAEAAAIKRLKAGKLTLALEVDEGNRISVRDRSEVPVGDGGKKVAIWRVPSLRELFRGDGEPPADIERYPQDYVPCFFFIERMVLEFCYVEGPRTDQEMEKLFGVLRRRPDGKSVGPLHDALWQTAALLLGKYQLSERQFTAIFGQLEKSARRWAQAPVSRNYVNFLRRNLDP